MHKLDIKSFRVKPVFAFTIFLFFGFIYTSQAQKVINDVTDFKVSNSKVVKLGHVPSVLELKEKKGTSSEKKLRNKQFKKLPDNFQGRRGFSKSVYEALEHQGPDPIRQSSIGAFERSIEPKVNINGIGDFGSPHDPTGDVSGEYYVQMINITTIAVYSLDGELINQFNANTLWAEFSQSSAGDPIVLYDENVDRWILTEFASPANILIAVSDNGNPLGGYTAYNFSTPNFPDYPKYALYPDILTLTTNEEGGTTLHNYFIDLEGLYAGDDDVALQRIEIAGNNATEAGFYVTTPVDWNGQNLPFDNKPITINISDSSWPGGPAQDQIDIYTFNIDFDNESNSSVAKTELTTTPFDGFPCSEFQFTFSCIPQLDGSAIDGVPEVIMNLPHLRNFGTHESMVFSFITDVTDGENLSGIRWMELRRQNVNDSWDIFQEGTFAPDDGLHRFMPSIAIDGEGNIGLAYNVSSSDIYIGARFTGRTSADPLGQMTINEYNIVEGKGPISSSGRFGDYSHMSVSPAGDNTFWWTTEYAGEASQVSQTRIVSFSIIRDTFDLTVQSINNPTTSSTLTAEEMVSITVLNSGIEPLSDFETSLIYRNKILETRSIQETLEPDSSLIIAFDSTLNLSEIDIYQIGAAVTSNLDQNPGNDTLYQFVRQLYELDASIDAVIEQGSCTPLTPSVITVKNEGATPIDSLAITIEVNGVVNATINYTGSISYNQSASILYEFMDLPEGSNEVTYTISSVNGNEGDDAEFNNIFNVSSINLPSDHFITLEFLTDQYPEESKWILYDEDENSLLASGEFSDPGTLFTEAICVNPDSCYTLIVTDTQSDGICCGFGIGNFSILDNQGELIAFNDGDFGSRVEINFCATASECSLDAFISVLDATSETANNGFIHVEASSGVAPYQFSIDGGAFQLSPSFSNLAPGSYEITVKDANGVCEITKIANIFFPSSVKDYDIVQPVVTITPNPSNGIFKLVAQSDQADEPFLNVQLLTITGELLQDRQIGLYSEGYLGTLSMVDYEPGTYLLKARNNDISFVRKIILASQ